MEQNEPALELSQYYDRDDEVIKRKLHDLLYSRTFDQNSVFSRYKMDLNVFLIILFYAEILEPLYMLRKNITYPIKALISIFTPKHEIYRSIDDLKIHIRSNDDEFDYKIRLKNCSFGELICFFGKSDLIPYFFNKDLVSTAVLGLGLEICMINNQPKTSEAIVKTIGFNEKNDKYDSMYPLMIEKAIRYSSCNMFEFFLDLFLKKQKYNNKWETSKKKSVELPPPNFKSSFFKERESFLKQIFYSIAKKSDLLLFKIFLNNDFLPALKTTQNLVWEHFFEAQKEFQILFYNSDKFKCDPEDILYFACTHNSVDTLTYFIKEKNFNPNVNIHGLPLLYLAYRQLSSPSISFLLDEIKVEEHPSGQQYNFFEYVLKFGYNHNQLHSQILCHVLNEYRDKFEKNIIHYYSISHPDNFDLLDLLNFDMNAKDEKGFPALYYAYKAKDNERCLALIKAKADVSFKDPETGKTLYQLINEILPDHLSLVFSSQFDNDDDGILLFGKKIKYEEFLD